jgi:hypothetical protein
MDKSTLIVAVVGAATPVVLVCMRLGEVLVGMLVKKVHSFTHAYAA